MLRRRNHATVTALVGLMLASCAGAPAPRTSVGRVWSHEAEIFAAAVRGIQARSSLPLHVDPRPIRISDQIDMPDVADYYQDGERTTRERAAVLRELGIDTVRAFPLRAGCTGFLFPPGKKRTDGCPVENQSEQAFDRVRPAAVPARWLLRMILVDYTPGGRSATTFQLTMAAQDGEFILERLVVLVEFD